MTLSISGDSGFYTSSVDEPVSQICIAARDGDLETLQSLLNDSDNDVNDVDPQTGCPPLHFAVKYVQVKCVEMLLNHEKINIDKYNRMGMTALQVAINFFGDNLEIVRLLLRRGAAIGDRSGRSTAFHKACSACGYGVRELIELVFNERKYELISDNKWVLFDGKIPHTFAKDKPALRTLLDIDDKCDLQVELSGARLASLLVIAVREPDGDQQLLSRCLRRFGCSVLKTHHVSKVLNSCINVDCLKYLLEHGCPSFQMDLITGDVSLDFVCKLITNIDLNGPLPGLVLKSITPEIIANFETWHRDTVFSTHASFMRHPLQAIVSAISRSAILSDALFALCDFLSTLIQHGFDSNILRYSFCSQCLRQEEQFLHYLTTLQCYRGHYHNILSQAILTVRNDYFPKQAIPTARNDFVLKRVVSVLIQSGASANATFDRSIPPLIALALRKPSEFTLDIFSLLIAAGADLNYRRDNSRFKCSEVAVAAALTGNTVLLPVIVTELGLDSARLLSDLLQIDLAPRRDSSCSPENNQSVAVPNVSNIVRCELRRNVSASIAALLKFINKSPDLLHLCQEIERHFGAASFGSAAAVTVAALGSASVQSENVSEYDIESHVALEFEKIDRLKQMCRAVLLNRLSAANVGDLSFRTLIDTLPVPDSLKGYLLFVDQNPPSDSDDLD